MWLPETKRRSLDSSSDFSVIDSGLRNEGTLATEGLILDEDLPATQLMRELRARQLRFRGGRGALSRYRRVEVGHSGHLFSTTQDQPLLEWCHRHGYILLTCNVKDFEKLDRQINHSGIIASTNQGYPACDPSNFADKCEKIFKDWRKHQFKNRVFTISP